MRRPYLIVLPELGHCTSTNGGTTTYECLSYAWQLASYLVLLLSSCLLGYENGQFTLHNVVSYALGDHGLL